MEKGQWDSLSSTSSTLVITPLSLPSVTANIVLVGRLPFSFSPAQSLEAGGLGAGLLILPNTSLEEAVFRSRLPSREDMVLSIASSLVADVEIVLSLLHEVAVEIGLEMVGFSDVEVWGWPGLSARSPTSHRHRTQVRR